VILSSPGYIDAAYDYLLNREVSATITIRNYTRKILYLIVLVLISIQLMKKFTLGTACGFMALLSVLSAFTPAAFINSITAFAEQPATTTTTTTTLPTTTTGGGNNALDFGSLNFANNMLNGSSIFGAAGVSMVDGIKVTGVTLLPNSEISIQLRHIITTTPALTVNASLPRSVTVTLIRIPMNLQDLTSMVAAASNMTNNNNTGNPAASAMQGFSSPMGAVNSNNFNPLSMLKNIQLGSSSLVNANWNFPQTVTMGLTGLDSRPSSSSPSSLHPETADFIVATVIPYTGTSNPNK
jgi:hypothetical protein